MHSPMAHFVCWSVWTMSVFIFQTMQNYCLIIVAVNSEIVVNEKPIKTHCFNGLCAILNCGCCGRIVVFISTSSFCVQNLCG